MWKKSLLILPLLLFAALLLLRPEAALTAAEEGLALCLGSVVPALFPMMVVTSLLLRLGAAQRLQPLLAPFMRPLFHLRGACAAPLLMGMVGGYPVGAAAAADLYRQGLCTRGEAERLLAFCNNCGPAFLVSYVGAELFRSPLTGARLYLIHIGSALVTGLLLARRRPRRPEPLPLPARGCGGASLPLARAFTQAVTGSFQSVLNVCAFVVLFTVAAALLPEETPAFAAGLLEMTGGVSRLPATHTGLAAAAALVGFGGLSVHCQTLAVLGDTDLSPRLLFPGKVLQAALSAALAALLL